MKKIYLDYNATTPVAPSVLEAMQPFYMEHYGNPSSSHTLGRAAAEAIEDARGKVAGMIGCHPEEIIFTGGGTESNNLAIKGTMFQTAGNLGGHMIISAIEHPAVSEPARFLERLGFDLTVIPCDSKGVVAPDDVDRAIRSDSMLVSIMHSNNEVGSIQPISEIAKICQEKNVKLHTDASQSCGKVATDVEALGVDMLTIAGHKFYGPKGIGALYVRGGTPLEPFMHGAAHERGLRPGTENTPSIVGLGMAAKLAGQAIDDSYAKMSEMRDQLLGLLRENIDGLVVNAEAAERLPNTLSVSLPGVLGTEVLARIPELSASTGSACHSSCNESSVLGSMGVAPETIQGTLRLSVGWHTNQDEIERAANLIVDAWENLFQPA